MEHVIRRSPLVLWVGLMPVFSGVFCSADTSKPPRIVLVSGQVYECKKPWHDGIDGMVTFELLSGVEVSVPKDKVDWEATRKANQAVPPGQTSQVERQLPKPDQARWALRLEGPAWTRIRNEIRDVWDKGPARMWNGSLSWGSWSILGSSAVLFMILASVELWLCLRVVGEPTALWRTMLGNVVLLVIAAAVVFLKRYSTFGYVFDIVLGIGIVLLVWSIAVVKLFDTRPESGTLAAVLYLVISILTWVGGMNLAPMIF